MRFRSCFSVCPGPALRAGKFVVRGFIVQALLLALPQLSFAQEGDVVAQHLQQELGLRQTVEALEAGGDTWHPLIAESMISLAQLMQNAGNHQEALSMLERAIHISRVNNGLFSLQQAPAIDMLVLSHMALGQWQEADSLRQYHFYIHSRSMQPDDPELIPALVSYAEWHLQSYVDRRVDVMPITRVIDAYQLYSVALNVADAQPEPAAWPREQFLKRMAYLAWRLSLAGPQMRPEVMYARSRQVDDEWVSRMTNGQNTLRPSTFSLGEDALKAIIASRNAHLQEALPDSSVRRDLLKQHVESVLYLADWNLLFMRRQGSAQLYQQAWAMLEGEDEELRKEVFGRVVTIPAFDEYLQPEPLELATTNAPALANSLTVASARATSALQQEWPWADMRFDLTRFGRVTNVELVNSSGEINDNVRRRLITGLRQTSMRPLISEAGLVASSGWLYRFPYDLSRMDSNFDNNSDAGDDPEPEEVIDDGDSIESLAFEAQ
jgi:tetratricopeptide (TPR) repeat protein